MVKITDAQEVLKLQKPRMMNCRFDKIYQFGDSLSDTGNCMRDTECRRLPYGMNFFHKATGRCSDGMLLIDFIDCQEKLNKSLFLVGAIGANDFRYGLLQGKTMDESRRMVPRVVQTIIHGVRTVIDFGATTIVVPGISPLGCLPFFQTKFRPIDNSTAYDEYHCLKDVNNYAIFHNRCLQEAIDELKKEYPNITLIYGDYYKAYMWLLQNAKSLAERDLGSDCGQSNLAQAMGPKRILCIYHLKVAIAVLIDIEPNIF
ncbi:hypothetical protein BC332_08712 [Capsicum chinense]|nr:hypothetical protein BC332_08712 [Capsicum chinense]